MASIIPRAGKWQAKIRRAGYPSLTRTFARREDALAWARAQEAEMDRGAWRDWRPASATTLHALLGHYLRDVVPSHRGAEIDALRIATLRRDEITRYTLPALTPARLAEWRDRRLAAGAAGSTVNRELNLISAVYGWARKDLMMAVENPVASIRRPSSPPGRTRRLEGDEEARLLAALADHSGEQERADGKRYRHGTRNPWIRPMVILAIESAMWRGELLALRWEDVDLHAHTAHLPITKNGQPRDIPLSSRAVVLLEDLKKGIPAPRHINGRVFPTTPAALKKAWERATAAAGIEDLRFHDLRHEATSRLAERLPNVVELAAVTGHRDLRMLSRYYHPRAGDLAQKLG